MPSSLDHTRFPLAHLAERTPVRALGVLLNSAMNFVITCSIVGMLAYWPGEALPSVEMSRLSSAPASAVWDLLIWLPVQVAIGGIEAASRWAAPIGVVAFIGMTRGLWRVQRSATKS